MYAAKQSIIAKEHDNEVQATVFYMELRAFGKDFDKYIDKAKNDSGVIYKRAMISEIIEDPETHNLLIHSVDDDGKLVNEEFDMVILSIGFEPRADHVEFYGLARQLQDDGYCVMHHNGHPVGDRRFACRGNDVALGEIDICFCKQLGNGLRLRIDISGLTVDDDSDTLLSPHESRDSEENN